MAGQGDSVSLGEILSVRGDADAALGSNPGGDAGILNFDKGLMYLTRAAENVMEAEKFKYLEFQKNMQNHFANFNSIDITGLSPADQKKIGEEYASVAKFNADNIDVIKNPNKNPALYSEIKTKEANLLKNIAASKMHKSYDDKTQDFVKANPDWQDINKPKVESSLTTPTDDWKPYTLDMPVSYSPSAVAKIVEPIAKQKYAEATYAKGYITEEEGVRYRKQAWNDAWSAIHSATDPAGRSLEAAARKAFEKLPPEAKGGTFDEWFQRTRDSLVPQDEVTKKNVSADQTYNAEKQRQLTAAEGAADRANRLKIAREQIEGKQKKIDTNGVGRLYNEELTGFKTGQFSIAALNNIYGDDAKVTLKSGTKIPDMSNPGQVTETTAEVQVPKKVVVSSSLDANGNLVYKYIDYSKPKASTGGGGFFNFNSKPAAENIGGYEVQTSEPISFKQGRTDFYRIIGDNDAPKVADVAEKYRVKNNLGINPDLEVLTKYFFKEDTPASSVIEQPFKMIKGTTQKADLPNGETIYTNDNGETFYYQDGKKWIPKGN